VLELQKSITRENLRTLMSSFYQKAIKDQELSPFFIDEIGDDIRSEEWAEHIELLADFWLAKLLGEDTYYGNFVGAHVKMPHIKRESYARWLELFSQTADEVYLSDTAELFKKKAVELVKEFFTSSKKI
jgi:hemoglobin